jgi:predicted lipoprotein with Yx(FWY)xxD motif
MSITKAQILILTSGALLLVVVVAVMSLEALKPTSSVAKTSLARTTVTAKRTTYQAGFSNAIVMTKSANGLGQYLAEPNGRALYTYSKDAPGVSSCNDACAVTWPPYEGTGSNSALPANVGTIRRSDGKLQFTYRKMPLYTFTGDSTDTANGNNRDDFVLARP